MSDRLKIPPTKSALLRIQGQVEFLEQGHTLLERKKELITRLVYDRLAAAAIPVDIVFEQGVEVLGL